MLGPQVNPSVAVGMNRSYYASITNFLGGSVGSSNICIPNFRHWFGFIRCFYNMFPNHKPYPNFIITTLSESSVNSMILVQIGIFTCYVYYGSNGGTVHSSEVNGIGKKFSPKQWFIIMIVHFSGWFPPKNLVLIFMYFIRYPTIACIDVKYQPIYMSIRDKVFQSIPCNAVPKFIIGDHTELLLFVSYWRNFSSVWSRYLWPAPIGWGSGSLLLPRNIPDNLCFEPQWLSKRLDDSR